MNKRTKARWYVLLIFVACAAPVALSFFTYYIWKPQSRMNYGELLKASPLSLTGLKSASGQAVPMESFQGKWILLLVDRPDCDAACANRLYAMRQTALAMEIKKDKLAQAWMTDRAGTPNPELLMQYQRTVLLAPNPDWLRQLPQPAAGKIFLVDPNGLPVLRYPDNPDIKKMMKDLGRLLDVKRM